MHYSLIIGSESLHSESGGSKRGSGKVYDGNESDSEKNLRSKSGENNLRSKSGENNFRSYSAKELFKDVPSDNWDKYEPAASGSNCSQRTQKEINGAWHVISAGVESDKLEKDIKKLKETRAAIMTMDRKVINFNKEPSLHI